LRKFLLFSLAFLTVSLGSETLYAQSNTPTDTIRITLSEFIQKGIENAGLLQVEQNNVELAEHRVNEAHEKRILPRVSLSTQHGLIPGVESDSTLPGGRSLPRDEYYLDPNLRNDWNNWAIFTRAEVEAVQPLFTWGAINKAIEAAKAGAEAARKAFDAKENAYEQRLYQLYMSHVLAFEVQTILEEAQKQIDKIDKQIKEMEEEGNPDLDQSDAFKFRVYKSQFQIRVTEVQSQIDFVKRVWDYVLQADPQVLYLPTRDYLEAPSVNLQSADSYRQMAMENRAELDRITQGMKAAELGIKATKAQSYPALFLGLTASYANTPNRPRQSNPFIINNTNYASAGFGFSIRQNLNFWSISNQIKKQRIQYRKLESAQHAAQDGITLEVLDTYRKAVVTESKVTQTQEALVTSKQWLRQEQLDYDFGMGDVKDLLDALRSKLELEVQLKQHIFDFHVVMGELYTASGIPISKLVDESPNAQ
jgi:outer membrane protein TolC